ncbi:MAG: NB-ARC domain-containing protein [Cyanobacteriota bacterium]|nr:NB-ARC domain-containing protein [Cyanobacteriota bacterium]
MAKLPAKRNRGVILTKQGLIKLQNVRNQTVNKKGNRISYEKIQDKIIEKSEGKEDLCVTTIRKIFGVSVPVDIGSIECIFDCFNLELCESDYTRSPSKNDDFKIPIAFRYHWGKAPDVSVFYGRLQEQNKLKKWVLEEKCRLVTLLGIGGVGKSTLAVKLGKQIQSEFDVVVWQSLQKELPPEETLTNILKIFISALQQDSLLPQSFDDKLSMLMEYLTNKRCLLILDDVEEILSSNGQAGQFRRGYERYSQLFKLFGEAPHNSCVLLTSREKPIEILHLEGEATKVKCLQIKGLNPTEGCQLFQQTGQFSDTKQDWEMLIEHYAGNPLMLKMLASRMKQLPNRGIVELLDDFKQGPFIFEEMRCLLECQFQRLSLTEKGLMYCLAVNRKAFSLGDLINNTVPPYSKVLLLKTILSLLQRSLIEKNGEHFFIQPVVMEYAKQQSIESFPQEIRQWVIRHRESNIDLKNQLSTLSIKAHTFIKIASKNCITNIDN